MNTCTFRFIIYTNLEKLHVDLNLSRFQSKLRRLNLDLNSEKLDPDLDRDINLEDLDQRLNSQKLDLDLDPNS